MTSIPDIPKIQRQGHDAMLTGRALRTPNHPEGFTFNPYPPGSAERINFNVGCIIAAFPRMQ